MEEKYTQALVSLRRMVLASASLLQNISEEKDTASSIADLLKQVEVVRVYLEGLDTEEVPPGEDLGLGCLSIAESIEEYKRTLHPSTHKHKQ
ncbi:hypothetical protein NECID01_1593 [Nematocida sp. AWRm77]|nr:hypothetical protein NECID01_1593 [Nematocida sp. AWRm77]